jgi:hypothetical protein
MAEDDEVLTKADEEMGGDPSCWLHLFCPDCGVQLDGTAHHAGCQAPVASEDRS